VGGGIVAVPLQKGDPIPQQGIGQHAYLSNVDNDGRVPNVADF
jgi:hypothetical protein